MISITILFYAIMATTVGVAASRCAPWSANARSVGLDWAVGIALGPFVAGIIAILALASPPLLSRTLIVWGAMAAALIVVAVMAWRHQRIRLQLSYQPGVVASLILASFCALSLTVQSAYYPFYANDALEYVTVSRELYLAPALSTYPVFGDATTVSGFYGPWTHPPLYPAVLYLLNQLAQQPDALLLSKLVPLWFFLGGIAVVFSLGLKHSTLAAGLAVFSLIAVPLVADSVGTALIDALPMVGLLLVFAGQVGLEGKPGVRGALTGVVLGLALWTHSQSILFIPLYIVMVLGRVGILRGKSAAVEIVSCLAVAAVISFWPYFRNWLLFGSPVSDNPLVFALPFLGWGEYFAYARGISSLVAGLQYGVLKGWFATSSFGSIFWIASLSVAVLLFSLRGHYHSLLINGYASLDRRDAAFGALLVLSAYLFACLVSVLAGIDLMIKNERYLLMMMPFAAILAAYGLSACILTAIGLVRTKMVNPWTREAAAMGLTVVIAIALTEPLVAQWRWVSLAPSLVTDSGRDARYLSGTNNIDAMFWLRSNTPADSLVLAMRPADMYYSGRRMVSYLDPKLVPAYEADTTAKAGEILRGLGITHIQMPDYLIPPLYATKLGALVADGHQTRLLHDSRGYQIYSLERPSSAAPAPTVVFASDFGPWTRSQSNSFPGLRTFASLDTKGSEYIIGTDSVGASPLGLFNRNFVTRLSSSSMDLHALAEERVAKVSVALSGTGFVQVWAYFGAAGSVRLAELVLVAGEEAHVERLLTVPDDADELVLAIDHLGNSAIKLSGVTFSRP